MRILSVWWGWEGVLPFWILPVPGRGRRTSHPWGQEVARRSGSLSCHLSVASYISWWRLSDSVPPCRTAGRGTVAGTLDRTGNSRTHAPPGSGQSRRRKMSNLQQLQGQKDMTLPSWIHAKPGCFHTVYRCSV